MADIEELVLKVGVEVDQEQLKRLRDEIEKLKSEGKKNAIHLGVDSEHPSVNQQGQTTNPIAGLNTNYSDEIVALLALSEKHMVDMLTILKSDHEKKGRTTDAEEKAKEGGFKIPLVNDISNQGVGGAVGGLAGGALGIVGGPGGVLAGASIGSAIGNLVEKILGGIKEKLEGVSKLFDERLTEDIHFRQLSNQTGLAVESIYKLGVQARLAGSSLEEVIDSNQNLADELITGISEKKAQLLLALNINPREALIRSGGDIGKLNQLIFERAQKALVGANPYYRTSVLKGIGYSAEEQTSRNYLYRPDTRNRAEQTFNIATQNGAVPLRTGEQLQQEVLDFRGAVEDFKGSIRSALSAGNLAQTLSTALMTVKADVVNLIATSITGLTTPQQTKAARETLEKQERTILNKASGEGGNNAGQALFDFFSGTNNQTPASSAGAAKAAVP